MGFKQAKNHRTDEYWYHQVGIVLIHFGEQAMGDLDSAGDHLRFMNKAGYEGTIGFNLDGSHMKWKGISVIDFIREYGHAIHSAHIKDVWVAREHTRAGRQAATARWARNSTAGTLLLPALNGMRILSKKS